jgi:nitronate monooxygenase
VRWISRIQDSTYRFFVAVNVAHADDHKHDHRNQAISPEDMMISTRFTERFGIKHPIVCAPMALVTGGALAAAVCRAGGLGIVGGGYAGTLGGEPDLGTELSQAASGKFGVGFITWALARAPKMLTKALQHSPFCVFLSFGDPRPFAAEIRDAGAALICQVQFLSQIDVALEAGAAAIVVQGTEAGGHGGNRSTFPFVPEAADYLKYTHLELCWLPPEA